MSATAIEWTERTWNPIVGCSIVSPGCTNCYAMRMAARLERMAGDGIDDNGYAVRGSHPLDHYQGTTSRSKAGAVWTGKVALAPDSILLAPLRRRKPTTWFVNSMGDLFHESVPDEWIDRVFAVMALAPQHQFQVLTKRSARMRAYCSDADTPRRIHGLVCDMVVTDLVANVILIVPGMDPGLAPRGPRVFLGLWPLHNVWLGVSAEDQRRADERVPDLLATPAAVRFVSAEPLLGPIRFFGLSVDGRHKWDWLKGEDAVMHSDGPDFDYGPRLDWIIVGGESGPGARPMHPDWARSIRDQCAAAGVPFFFKQWGGFEVAIDRERDDPDWRRDYSRAFADDGDTVWLNLAGGRGFHGERFHVMRRVGKARAGRLLDGVEHNAMPVTP